MTVQTEFARLMRKAGVHPYRRVGRVRAAHDPATPADTLRAALAAVRRFAPALVDEWGEPVAAVALRWRDAGLVPADVCDDPCPADVDPAACPVEWLAGRAARYHFRFTCPEPGRLLGVGLDGWKMEAVRPLLPGWYVAATKARVAELVEYAASAREPETEGDRRRLVRGV